MMETAGQPPQQAAGLPQAARDIAGAIAEGHGSKRRDRAYVVAQLGQSLDGRIATRTGDSQWINGPAALDFLHLLRASVDAVVVGAGTIVADDPRLNVRRCAGQSPARVILDPTGRIGAGGQWLADDGVRVVRIVAVDAAPIEPVIPRLETLVVPRRDGWISPKDIIQSLQDTGFSRILIEGGARTVSHFLECRALDRLELLMGPVIIGSGRQGIDLTPIDRLADAARPRVTSVAFETGDVLFDCSFAVASD